MILYFPKDFPKELTDLKAIICNYLLRNFTTVAQKMIQ